MNNFKFIGKDVSIYPLAKILFQDEVSIGNAVVIDDFVFIAAIATISDFVHIASFVSITGKGIFTMESFSGIASGSRIITGNDNWKGEYMNGPSIPYPYRNATRSFVHIKKHVVVGANSVVMPGVTLNEGALIGACSFVNSDCDPWSVYVGCPAKKVKEYSPDKIFELETQLRKNLYDQNGIYKGKV